ncbi:MAG: S24 family peptidase [Ignavibacteriae bacterium]|nr:S24 family peptidase [Ignavibacteriota bacterium]
MRRSDFKAQVEFLSNSEIYELVKKFYVQEGTGFNHNNWKIDIIYDFCQNKNPMIFSDAMADASCILSSRETGMNELKVVDIKRIDYLTKQELVDFVSQMIGAAKTNPVMDLNDIEKVDILKSFGLNQNTIICKVTGQSMENARIFDGDTLVVDTKSSPRSGNIVVASVNSELFVKRLKRVNGTVWLLSENEEFKDLEITPDYDFRIIGVVKKAVRNVI